VTGNDQVVSPDRAYFERLYREHYAAIMGYAARRSDEHTARDIVAETFLRAWRRLDAVPPDHELPWLYTVARNVLIEHQRSSSRRERLAERMRSQRLPSQLDDPADGVAATLDAARLLDALPPTDREALQLIEWEGLDIATAARIVGCTPATFRVRLHRARARLVKQYDRLNTAHVVREVTP
jgi:RNA polymerase sigma-70 factor (ECF subfamily)